MPFGQGTWPTYPPLSWHHTHSFYRDDGRCGPKCWKMVIPASAGPRTNEEILGSVVSVKTVLLSRQPRPGDQDAHPSQTGNKSRQDRHLS